MDATQLMEPASRALSPLASAKAYWRPSAAAEDTWHRSATLQRADVGTRRLFPGREGWRLDSDDLMVVVPRGADAKRTRSGGWAEAAKDEDHYKPHVEA